MLNMAAGLAKAIFLFVELIHLIRFHVYFRKSHYSNVLMTLNLWIIYLRICLLFEKILLPLKATVCNFC